MRTLRAFEGSHEWLDRNGYPKIDIGSGYRVIREDFEIAFRNGQISFEQDGIYLEYQEKKHRGYMFLKTYQIALYGPPKFHIVKCEKVQEFIATGTFSQRYVWSNSEANTVIDRSSRLPHENVVLEICGYCRKLLTEDIVTTGDFAATMRALGLEAKEVEVDIRGYVKGWEKISRDLRKAVGYQCGKCHLKITNQLDHRYLQVHHIDGNKLNNEPQNLQCLCVRCHAAVDARHVANFGRAANRRELEAFLRKYGG